MLLFSKAIMNQQQFLVFDMKRQSVYLLLKRSTEKLRSNYPGIGYNEVSKLLGEKRGQTSIKDSHL